jgi:hypothetical protein
MATHGAFEMGSGMVTACGSCGHAASTHHIELRGACRSVTLSAPGPDAFRMLCGCRRYVEDGVPAVPTTSFSGPFASAGAAR